MKIVKPISTLAEKNLRCNCSDTCGAVTIPGVPLRKGSSLQAYLIGDTVIEATLSKTLGFVFYMNLGFLILIASQGIVSLFKAQWEQREVRNWIFRYLIGRSHCSNPSDITPKLRFLFAKYGAAVFYLTDIVAAIISPFIFISSVFTNEIRAWGYPVSESSGAVGQVWIKEALPHFSFFNFELSGVPGPPSVLSS